MNRLVRLGLNGERHDLVRRTMIRPELLPIERQRARRERNPREVFDSGRPVAKINPRDAPLFRFARRIGILLPADDVEHSVGKGVAANLSAGIDRAQDRARVIYLMNVPFVPLAQVAMLAIEAEIRTRELRAREEFPKAIALRVAI